MNFLPVKTKQANLETESVLLAHHKSCWPIKTLTY